MPPRGRTSSRSSNRSTSRANRGAASRRARSAARARARARAAAAKRRDAARPSVRRSRAASTARSSRSGVRTGSRTGGTSAAARRRDAARPSVRRAAAASAARSSRSGVRTGSRTGGPSAAARRRDAARPSVVRSRAASAAARRRDANRPSVRRARTAAANRMIRANQTPARTSTAPLSERRNAASAKLARQRLQTLAADRRRRQRQASGQADLRRRRNAAANKQAAQSLLGAGYRNVAGDRNRSTLGQQFMSGIRNLMRGELGFVFPGSGGPRKPSVDDFKDRRKGGGGDDVVTTDTTTTTTETTPVTEMPPEIIDDYSDRFPTGPGYGGGMMGGLGGFGYSPALMAYESQQGAGQVPYYMAAARNAMTPNMSPAFMHAARNYDILGGMQRTRARPIEMMSARERAEIMNMGSNFNVPNYNSPYPQSPGQSQFDYFRNMVRDSATPETQPQVDRNMFPTSGIPTGPGKGAARPMSQDQARAMGSGLGSLMRSGMMGMF